MNTYSSFGEAAGHALSHNARMAAEHAVQRADGAAPQCTGGAAIDHPETGVCNHAATTPEPAAPTLTISVHRTNAERALQLNLSQTDAAGNGFGYRLAGPKHYNMGTKELLSSDLDERDAREVRSMLDAAFPPKPAPTADVTVYELRTGTDDDPRPEVIARYATWQAAAAHGEQECMAARGTFAALEWPPTGTDDAPRYRLMAVDDLDGEETLLDWHIVPVTIPAAYTPAGGEQA